MKSKFVHQHHSHRIFEQRNDSCANFRYFSNLNILLDRSGEVSE